MEDERALEERRCQRCYECSRVEEEVWSQAYELVWPLVRQAAWAREVRASQRPARQPIAEMVAKGA